MAGGTDLPQWSARGERVWVSTVRQEHVKRYRTAVQQSADRLRAWNPVDPDDLPRHLAHQSAVHRTFVVEAADPGGAHGVVGRVNVTNIVQGRFRNGTLGYDAYDPYVGRGLMAEGLRLVVDLAFRAHPEGLGLHRLEANVQPGNTTSAGMLRRLGFRREARVPQMLWLADARGEHAWRDHDSHALLASDWPAPAYAPHRPARVVVLVNGLPGSGKTTLARQLAAELGVPLLSKDVVKETVWEHLPDHLRGELVGNGSALGAGATQTLWRQLADSPTGAVVESFFHPGDERFVIPGLVSAGVPPDAVTQVWCDVPTPLARDRFEDREPHRHPVHGPQRDLSFWDELGEAGPIDVGRVLRVDTTGRLTAADVVRVGLECRARSVTPPGAAPSPH